MKAKKRVFYINIIQFQRKGISGKSKYLKLYLDQQLLIDEAF